MMCHVRYAMYDVRLPLISDVHRTTNIVHFANVPRTPNTEHFAN